MKQKLVTLSLLLTLFFVFASGCKKDGTEKRHDLKSRITGKWSFLRNTVHSVVDGKEENEVENENEGNYFFFQPNGSFAALLGDEEGVGSWKVEGERVHITILNDDVPDEDWEEMWWDVLKLTDKELVLYEKRTEGADFWEYTLYLKR